MSRLLGIVVVLASCGGSSPDPLDAAVAADIAACEAVGTAYCQQAYACFTAAQLAGYQLPATQAECVTMENSQCDLAAPEPGFCKGSTQTSTATATACAADLSGMTCDEFDQAPPANDVCKTQLCAGD